MIEAPAPGVYRDVIAAEYHRWPLAAQSILNTIRSGSPEHAYAAMHDPTPATPAMIVGDALHLAALQPDLLETRYCVAGQCEAIKKSDGKQCTSNGSVQRGGHWFCGIRGHDPGADWREHFATVHAMLLARGYVQYAASDLSDSRYYQHDDGRKIRVSDHEANEKTALWMQREGVGEIRVDLPPYGHAGQQTVLTPADFDRVRWMRDKVMGHPEARLMFDRTPPQDRELSVVWKDGETGVACKARLDMLVGNGLIVADIKTCRDAHPRRFPYTIDDRGYHLQADQYMHAATAAGYRPEAYRIIAVENTAPFGVAVYQLDQDTLIAGHAERVKYLKAYKQCVESGVWPGYGDDAQTIGLKYFAHQRIEQETAE